MKKIIYVLSLLCFTVVLVGSSGCTTSTTPSADKDLQVQTEQMMQEANAQVGMPAIVNWQEKKTMKLIYELRDQENLICYAYLVNEYKGCIGQFLGKCYGYGLPYSTQFSNPSRLQTGGNTNGYYGTAMPQPEPNGLFMPEGLDATFLLLLDGDGKPHPVYIESKITVSPFPLHEIKEDKKDKKSNKSKV